MKKKKLKTQAEIFAGVRKSWNGVNPVTKIIPNKKKNPKRKYKGEEE